MWWWSGIEGAGGCSKRQSTNSHAMRHFVFGAAPRRPKRVWCKRREDALPRPRSLSDARHDITRVFIVALLPPSQLARDTPSTDSVTAGPSLLHRGRVSSVPVRWAAVAPLIRQCHQSHPLLLACRSSNCVKACLLPPFAHTRQPSKQRVATFRPAAGTSPPSAAPGAANHGPGCPT